MRSNLDEERLSQIEPRDRVLLLSHCLRPSQSCPTKYSKQGLECSDDCAEDCVVGRLRRAALSLGYKGVCIAPGGRLAVRYIAENNPVGIVALACTKELEEGVRAVKELAGDSQPAPVIVVVPLSKDGCVDTEVDEKLALDTIALGCSSGAAKATAGF
ncbi:MAG: DUF116 domain-containing protein [Chloroflexi bacterium]|nr:DUF116 domain-containing protein [Chloroflexota bacterium]